MPNQLQFMDCPNCSKRVATTAKVCNHCGQSPTSVQSISERARGHEDSEESHMAAENGVYDVLEDDFDYKKFVADEFHDPEQSILRRKTWWWFTAWLMIIVFSLPILLQAMSLFN